MPAWGGNTMIEEIGAITTTVVLIETFCTGVKYACRKTIDRNHDRHKEI